MKSSSVSCVKNGEDDDESQQKKKEIAIVKKTLRVILFFVLIVIFLMGQYVLAGKMVDNTILPRRNFFMKKHRRNLEATIPKLQFPSTYHVIGILKLPYGSIDEPFEAWYSKDDKMSRIDYYGGMDRTYQREDLGEYGFGAKVIPEFSEEKKKIFRGCLHHVGTKRFPIKAQSIIPTDTEFKFDGECMFNKTIPCYKWKHSFKVLTKINDYALYTTRTQPSIPLQYDMMGYDTLLASYYDKYVLLYEHFEQWNYDFQVFEIPSDVHCFDLSGQSEASEITVASFNPMLEFMSAHQSNKEKNMTLEVIDDSDIIDNTTNSNQTNNVGHFEFIVEKIFKDYKDIFQKEYKDEKEHVKRKDIFRHNLRFINHKNRQNLTYKLHLNHFADISEEEMKHYRGLLNESYVDRDANLFKPPNLNFSSISIPKSLDWRKYGAISDVRSQGICGSCYAYAVTGAIEAAHYIKTGESIKLSEQQIVDCSWGFGNRGCKGGYPYRAMRWVIKHGGIATSKSYGKYLAQTRKVYHFLYQYNKRDYFRCLNKLCQFSEPMKRSISKIVHEGYCHFENVTHGASIEGYYNISQGNISQLKMAIALYGPVTILINTRPKSFKFYDSGVFYDKECDNRLDHAALAIGYGTAENGEDYWLIKNSWSISWGRRGFMKISMRNDNCGVTQKAVVVRVNG